MTQETLPTNTASALWKKCLSVLEKEYPADFGTWLRPLYPVDDDDSQEVHLLAPNQYVLSWVKQYFINRINELVVSFSSHAFTGVRISIGSRPTTTPGDKQTAVPNRVNRPAPSFQSDNRKVTLPAKTFAGFVRGKSNDLAAAAAEQAAKNPGQAYNPLLFYGGVGLGKTHLAVAVGNFILESNPNLIVRYLPAERYVADMVKALQANKTDEFKNYYRSVDVLIIDDIQFFAGKERSQEEFFYTFNALLESHKQIVLTSDSYPKEIRSLDERLKSRFGWGLTVAIEPPELETRVAILMSKAKEYHHTELPYEAAFFIAKRIRSNVRELEGALKRVIANAHFTGKPITVDFARESLKDLLALQDKLVTIENIQKTVAEYYKISLPELLSQKRSRSVVMPRQIAMALAKELTNHSLPEIGTAFGGRDHTTVLHACRKIKDVVETRSREAEDYKLLVRILTS